MRSSDQSRRGVAEEHWPAGATPLVAGVRQLGFAPVTEEILAEVVRRIVSALGPEKVVFSGSYVYGTPSSDSDVDLLVIMQTNARPADRYVAVSSLIRPRRFPLDISVKAPDEIAQASEKGDGFIREIFTQGRVLYERCD
jgi:uncharacterized protein